jgi:hypothetical protein
VFKLKNMSMSWTIAYDGEMEVIRATVTGELTAKGFKAMTAELLEESKRRDIYRILCDCRAASLAIKLSDIYSLPGELRELGLMSYLMVALVHSAAPEASSLFRFLDDRCHNTGLSQKAFIDYDLACLWLTGIDWSIVSNPTAVIAI